MNTKKLIKKQQQLNVIAACQKYYEMYGPISDRTIDSLNRSIDASLLDNEEKAFSMIVLAEESNKLNDAQPSIKYEKAKTKTTSTTSKTADGGTKTKSRASANSREVDIVTSYSFLAALLAEKSLELNDLLVRQEQLMKRKLDRSECQCARKEGKDNKK